MVLVQGWPARNGPHLDRLVAREARLAAHLQAAHVAGAHVMGLFTGVALLGAAGLLVGRKACMPWAFLASMFRMAPEVCPSDAAWVSDQRVWTAESPAQTTALLLEVLAACGLTHLVDALRPVVLHTPDRQRLLKAVAQDARSRLGPGSLERARQWLEDHLHEPYSLEATAQASLYQFSLLAAAFQGHVRTITAVDASPDAHHPCAHVAGNNLSPGRGGCRALWLAGYRDATYGVPSSNWAHPGCLP